MVKQLSQDSQHIQDDDHEVEGLMQPCGNITCWEEEAKTETPTATEPEHQAANKDLKKVFSNKWSFTFNFR